MLTDTNQTGAAMTAATTRIGRAAALRALFAAALAALLFAFSAGCGGGGGGGGSNNNNGGGVTALGRVIDAADSDRPVVGATVSIGGKSAVTGSGGEFTINDPARGANTAVVAVPGRDPQTLALEAAIGGGANNVGDLVINIGQVSGVLLLPGGAPAAGASVSLSSTGELTDADAQGRFLFVNVPLGTTTLTAVAPISGGGAAVLTRDVTIGNGVTALGDLRMTEDTGGPPPGAPRTLVGKIVLGGPSNGVGAAGTIVALFRDGRQLEASSTFEDGTFFFYVPAGTYTIQIRRATFRDASVGPFTLTDPSQALDLGTTTLEPSDP